MVFVELADAAAVDDDPIGVPRQAPIDRQVMPRFPQVDAALGGDDALDARRAGGRAAVGVGREHPGMDQIGFEARHVAAQPPPGERVVFPRLADDGDRDSCAAQVVLVGPSARERADVNVELVARESSGQKNQLLFGAGARERGDHVQDASRHAGPAARSSSSSIAT